MEEAVETPSNDLAHKIARLVEERGWNQEEFARIARLNRHTIRQILVDGGSRRLRNATISACTAPSVCPSANCAISRSTGCCRACATRTRPTAMAI